MSGVGGFCGGVECFVCVLDLKDQLESKSIAMEAYRTRVAQLEQIVNQQTEEIVVQKHRLTEIKEEYHEIVQVMEVLCFKSCLTKIFCFLLKFQLLYFSQ